MCKVQGSAQGLAALQEFTKACMGLGLEMRWHVDRVLRLIGALGLHEAILIFKFTPQCASWFLEPKPTKLLICLPATTAPGGESPNPYASLVKPLSQQHQPRNLATYGLSEALCCFMPRDLPAGGHEAHKATCKL